MKKLVSIITVLVLCLSLLNINVFAASASASASGPKSVEVGETLQVTLTVKGSDVYGMSGKISYDDTMLKLKSSSCKVSGWQLESNGSKFVAYDNTGDNPINSSAKVIVLKFTVLKAAAKQTVSVEFTDLVATDAKNDIAMGTASYSCSVKEKAKETTPTTQAATQPTVAPTEPVTEPAPTEPVTEPVTEPAPTEPAPTEPVDLDGGNGCQYWWLWILLLILLAVIIYIIVKKAKKK